MKYKYLTQGKRTIIDDDIYDTLKEYDNIFKWHTDKGRNTDYAASKRYKENKVYLHHFILGCPLGNYVIDHIDNDGLNNQRSNLRIITYAQNSAKSRRGNTGFPSVLFAKNGYQAAFVSNKKYYYLGRFKTAFEGFIAYRRKLQEIGEELLPEHENLYLDTINNYYTTLKENQNAL